MKRIFALLIAASFLAAPGFAFAEKLSHKYREGEKYRIVSEVDEQVFIDRRFNNRSLILNKVSVATKIVNDNSGHLSCDFLLSEKFENLSGIYSMKLEYHSEFWRDEQGTFTIEPHYYMPVLRDLPWFPGHEVSPGSTWSYPAREVHDLRQGYGIEEPFRFPTNVNYRYVRNEEIGGEKIAVLEIDYTTFHRVSGTYNAAVIPERITGRSKQILKWNIDRGKMHSSNETFDFLFFLSNGRVVEYTGTARAKLIPSEELNRDLQAEEIRKELKDKGLPGVTVNKNDRGLTITIEDIQFQPNSAELTRSEKMKLDSIAEILKKYKERDLLITGHTARVGPEETSQALSEQRARAVAGYLVGKDVHDRNQMFIQGKGSREPVAPNTTEEGRKRNRRVEITILEN